MGDGRVLWVTGAGSGMGLASARAAAADGRRVVLSGRRAEPLEDAAAAIGAAGGEALALPLDVADTGAVEDAHARIAERWGGVDDLVLAAGLNTPRRRWADGDTAEFARIQAVNLTGLVAVIQVALPDLRRSAGRVVAISSFAGWSFNPGAGVAYSASKTAVGVVCRTLNAEEWPNGVRATHLCPGDVDTDFLAMRPSVPDAAGREGMLQPEDVARAVRFVLDSPAHVRIDELVISPTHLR